MKTLIAILMKDPAASKSRLAPWMKPDARRLLALRMFEGTLTFFRNSFPEYDVAVVTSSTVVSGLATSLGAATIGETTAAGLNAAASLAMAYAREHGYARAALVPADIPVWMKDEVARLFALSEESDLVIAEAHDGGTNLILQSPFISLGYCYGPRSAINLELSSRALGLEVSRSRLPFISRDIDTIYDLAALDLDPATGKPVVCVMGGYVD